MIESRKHSLSYLVLALLVISSLFTSEAKFLYTFFAIVVFTSVKFLVVSFQFADVKRSHIAWKSLIVFFISSYIIVLWSLH